MKDFVEKLIERLEEASHWENPEYDEDGYADETWEVVYLDKAIKIVNQLAEEYGKDTNVRSNGWIPCSERLPEEEEYRKCNGQFIVSDGNRTYATYFDIYDTLKFGEPTIERFRVDMTVIAWQPLPQPYQKGE